MAYSYSVDEENFIGDFETPQEAAESSFLNYSDVDTVFVGVKHEFTAHDFIDAAYLMEKIDDEAYNECGESSLSWLSAIQDSKEKREAFKKLIGDWLEINAPVNFFKVDEVMEYTREDFCVDDEDGYG
jgi:hypothetical protein